MADIRCDKVTHSTGLCSFTSCTSGFFSLWVISDKHQEQLYFYLLCSYRPINRLHVRGCGGESKSLLRFALWYQPNKTTEACQSYWFINWQADWLVFNLKVEPSLAHREPNMRLKSQNKTRLTFFLIIYRQKRRRGRSKQKEKWVNKDVIPVIFY